MINKKILVAFGIGIIIGLILLFIFRVKGNGEKELIPVVTPTETVLSTPFPTYRLRPTLDISRIIENPRAPEIEISGVKVENFYRFAKAINAEGDTTIVGNDDYAIFYHPFQERFLISILGSPFPEKRQTAEQEFLEILGINQSDACRLTVSLTTPLSDNPEYAIPVYSLSFCEE